jgi:hypothetical protein
MTEREREWADLQAAVTVAAEAFKADPTHENLVRLNEVREALRQDVIEGGGEWTPKLH